MAHEPLAFTKLADGLLQNAYLEQKSHPVARSAVYSKQRMAPGTVLMEENALTSVLLPEQKGSRCDFCLRRRSSSETLKRCTGCVSYFYCDAACKWSPDCATESNR